MSETLEWDEDPERAAEWSLRYADALIGLCEDTTGDPGAVQEE